MPLISVIIPVYNAELYLDSCIKSISEQSFKDIEIILVDDGSSDSSAYIMSNWERLDSRVKKIHQKNSGVTIARKKGVDASTGKWIAFVDADDILPYNALEILFDNIRDSDLVIGQVDYVGPGKWHFATYNEQLTNIEYIKRMYQDMIHSVPFARLMKKEIFRDLFVFDIPKEITHGEDTIMNCRIAVNCKSIQTIPNIVYRYFVRDGSASRQNKFSSIKYCRLFEKNEWASFPDQMKKKLFYVHYKSILQRRKRWLKYNIKSLLNYIGFSK